MECSLVYWLRSLHLDAHNTYIITPVSHHIDICACSSAQCIFFPAAEQAHSAVRSLGQPELQWTRSKVYSSKANSEASFFCPSVSGQRAAGLTVLRKRDGRNQEGVPGAGRHRDPKRVRQGQQRCAGFTGPRWKDSTGQHRSLIRTSTFLSVSILTRFHFRFHPLGGVHLGGWVFRREPEDHPALPVLPFICPIR